MGVQRDFSPNCLYHIITRGNNEQTVFLHKRDRIRYLRCLEKYSRKFPIKTLAFCLMVNHVHLLLKEGEDTAISEFMHDFNTAYTMYFNLRHSRSGHLFEGPFKHILIELNIWTQKLWFYMQLYIII